MSAYWVHLRAELRDTLGSEHVQIQCAGPEVSDSHRLELRGSALYFDEIEELFAKHLDDSARLTWTLDVDVVRRGRVHTCPLRVDGWKRVPREAVVGTYPRPSFFVRAALTLETETLVSQWHIDWDSGFEGALSDLRLALGEEGTLRSCFFCKWSDYEPSTSTGHLGCFRAVKSEYEAIATSEDAWTRKYKKESLWPDRVWVDELNACDDFERRPRGFGYRG